MTRKKIESPHILNTDQGPLSYTLVRSSKRRSLVIRIKEDAQIKVSAPFYMADQNIQKFLLEKSSWIWKHRNKIKNSSASVAPKNFDNGEEYFFLGRKHKLMVEENTDPGLDAARLNFDGLIWKAQVPQDLKNEDRIQQIKERLMIWYRLQAKEVLGSRVFHYARLMKVEPKNITLRGQKRIWGSCDFRKRNISLNWQIIMSPPEVLDYVIVHELSHLVHPNHSNRFWKKVEEFHPQYLYSRQWLKKNQKEILSVCS